jgi:hypothetical protein
MELKNMYYVCVEDNRVVNILNYEPAVPSTVSIRTISDLDFEKIQAQTHIYDVASSSVIAIASDILSQIEIEKQNGTELEFLKTTDWKVLRHIRQKSLGIPTSLTESQYLDLERLRDAAASRIV